MRLQTPTRELFLILITSLISVRCLRKGRQPQLDYLCTAATKYAPLPWDCTGYIQCASDGFHFQAHWMKCPPYTYWNPLERTCKTDQSKCRDPKEVAMSECSKYTRVTFPHPDSCSKYYDCDADTPRYGLQKYENECPYPELYDVLDNICKPANEVDCGKNPRPAARCDYSLECGPCDGLPSGPTMIPDQPFSRHYLYCYNNQAYSPFICPVDNVFDPTALKCTNNYKVSISKYCAGNVDVKFADATSCAKFYDCRQKENSQLDTYQNECPYRTLYDVSSASCKSYDTVNCGDRPEPVSPCEYSVGRCGFGAHGNYCIPCEADCKGLPDGFHNYLSPSSGEFLECRDGRTVAIRTCPSGYHLSLNICVDTAGKTTETIKINETDFQQLTGDKTGGDPLLGDKDGGSTTSGTDGTTGSGTDGSGTTGGGTDGTGTTGGGTDGSGTSTNGTDGTENTGNGTDGSGTTGNATDGSGTTGNATDGSGTTGNATDGSGTTGNGTDGSGTTTNGTDGSGTTTNGTDGSGVTGNGTDGSGITGNGTDGSGTTTNGTDGSGVTGNGTDGSGTTTNGTDGSETTTNGTDGSETTGNGTDISGTTSSGTVTTIPPTPCTSSPVVEPLIQYYCNCTDELNETSSRLDVLEDFMLEQKAINALAVLECKNPPTLPHASTTVHHTLTGAEALYTCHQGYAFCGSRAISACPGNGTWEAMVGQCAQSVWNYPKVIFNQEFTCPLSFGTVITIYGTPTRFKKSMIDLIGDTDKALLLTICFQCGTSKKKVTFGAEVAGQETNLIPWQPFPFKVGREFKIVISVSERAYKIEINDEVPFYFPHVVPIPTVKSLFIADEITLRRVVIEPSNTQQTFVPKLDAGVSPEHIVDVRDTNYITFKVKACGHVHFHLATDNTNTSKEYLIHIGEDGNTLSTIRKCETCPDLGMLWHQPLHCSEFLPFWASWKNGRIQIGSGFIPGSKTFLDVTDTEYPINYFSTGQTEFGVAEWVFSTPIEQCGFPAPMKDTAMYVRENGLVGEAVYTCDDLFTFCGESYVSQCTDKGTWEGLKGECLLSTWQMMPLPASMPFPCWFGLGSVLSVYGTPLRPTKFSISLRSGADTLLIVTVAFNVDSFTNTVLYNSNLNQIWGQQEDDIRFPFQVMREFHLTITVEPLMFKVAVDGTEIYSYLHRASFESLNSAYISDDVLVRKVKAFPAESAGTPCPLPSAIPDGQAATIDTTPGTEVTYTCNNDYFFCGGGDTIVCDISGRWEGLDGGCVLGTWHNIGPAPNTGYKREFPCRYRDGMIIKIVGKPLLDVTNAPFFSVRLRDGEVVTLGIDFHKTEMKLNSKIPDWGTEEIATITPLEVQKTVEFSVMITEYEFVIFEGFEERYRYNHRTPVARVHEVIVLPYLEIAQLSFSIES